VTLAVFSFTLPGCARFIAIQCTGTTDIANVDCDIQIPAQVKVHVEVMQGNQSVGTSGNFPANGPFNLMVNWPKNFGNPTA
jgi:hypothetical protein